MLQNQRLPPKLLVSYLQLNCLFFLQGDQGPAGSPGPKGAPGVGIAGPKVRHTITDKVFFPLYQQQKQDNDCESVFL